MNNNKYLEIIAKRKATIQKKREINEVKKDLYSKSKKSVKRQSSNFTKQVMNIGDIYDEETHKVYEVR